MTTVDIPFQHGLHEETDSKLLPQGLFTVAQNVRYRKDGRLGIRYGYDFTSSAQSNTAYAISVGPKENLFISPRTSLPPAFQSRSVGGYTLLSSLGTSGGDLGVPERLQIIEHFVDTNAGNVTSPISPLSTATSVDLVNLNGTLTCAYTVGTPGSTPGRSNSASYFSTASTVPNGIPGFIGAADASATNIKLVNINGTVCFFWANSANQIRMSAGPFGTPVTVATAAAGRAPYFDVSPGGSATEAYLIYPTTTTLLSFGTVNTAGTFSLLNGIATTGTESRPSITPTFNAPTDQIAIVWNDGATIAVGNCKITVYRRSTSSFLVATTTVDNSGFMIGFPTIAPHPTQDWMVAASRDALSSASMTTLIMFTSSLSRQYLNGYQVASRPFTAGSGTYAVAVSQDLAQVSRDSTYVIVDPAFGSFPRIESVLAQGIGTTAVMWAAYTYDPRRSVVAATPVDSDPGVSAVIFAAPIQTLVTGGFILYRITYGSFGDTNASAHLNGETFLAGARHSEYDHRSVLSGHFIDRPRIYSATAQVGGAMVNGTYQYVAVFEYVDFFGYRHQSPPSLPMSVTLAGANASVQVATSTPSDTHIQLGGAYIRLYRTSVGGTVFQECYGISPAVPGAVTPPADALAFANDTQGDNNLGSVLYTQGERGGLSGIHENEEPPPARYITAGSFRLLIGGMENPAQVQWSKLQFDGEPITWADDPQWRATVDGRVTGVAELDGTWFVFTKDTVWTVVGDGPDDTGAGAFSSPQRLPSSIGCLSHKSIIKFGGGLLFQSTRGLEILPRGGGEPQWIGASVRDTLTSFPYVSASAFNQVEQVCYWAVTDAAGSAGRLIVYDIRIGEFYVDDFYQRAIKALSVYDGKLVIDGQMVETSTFTDDDTGIKTTAIVPVLTSGDIRAFGQDGWGRYRRVQILGEARDVSVAWSLSLEVSYDSGKTFGTPTLWTRANLATAIGDAIDGAEHMFVTQKTDSVRLRLSISTPSPTEGLVFNGLSLAVTPESDLKRQANAYRSP